MSFSGFLFWLNLLNSGTSSGFNEQALVSNYSPVATHKIVIYSVETLKHYYWQNRRILFSKILQVTNKLHMTSTCLTVLQPPICPCIKFSLLYCLCVKVHISTMTLCPLHLIVFLSNSPSTNAFCIKTVQYCPLSSPLLLPYQNCPLLSSLSIYPFTTVLSIKTITVHAHTVFLVPWLHKAYEFEFWIHNMPILALIMLHVKKLKCTNDSTYKINVR